VPDNKGRLVDVVHGYDNLEGYISNSPYFGAIIGRYGNRIAKGRFSLDGVNYQLPVNSGANHLHGGMFGFDKRLWRARLGPSGEGPSIILDYTSEDGEEGYPGQLKIQVIYTLTEDNSLRIDFLGTTDQATIVNLTHHAYFNLSGNGDILDHVLTINADSYTAVDANLITTGEILNVSGTPFDFRSPTPIGKRIDDPHPVLQYGPGYDHNWVINNAILGTLAHHASALSPRTGIRLDVYSTEPCIQFYAGNFLDGSITGKDGQIYSRRSAFCLEPQHAPDSPNKPEWPSVILRPGQVYKNTILYRFRVD